MAITKERCIKYQKENYNFDVSRIEQIEKILDWKRLEFELKRFSTFKRKYSGEVNINLTFNMEFKDGIHEVILSSANINDLVIGYIEKFLCKYNEVITSSIYSYYGNLHTSSIFDTCFYHKIMFSYLKDLNDEQMVISNDLFTSKSHEHTCHKGKTQKAFYEEFYKKECDKVERYIQYLENINVSVIEYYFKLCSEFFVNSYEDFLQKKGGK